MSAGTRPIAPPPALVEPAAPPAPRAGLRGWLALAALMLPVLLISVDNTVLSFALPQITEQLRPSAAQQLWIVDAYSLVLAALLVPMGSLGDRIGRRRLLLIGASGFALVSLGAAFAPDATTLIAARAVLGLFGATLMPATMSLLRTIFLDPGQRRLAIAVWAAGFAGGAALGPLLGGVLLEHFWWGSVFLLALPMLLPMLLLVPLLVPESRDPRPGRLDLWGILLTLAAMGAFAGGVKTLAEGALALGSGLVAAGVALACLFVRRQLRRPDPMLDMALFRHRGFSTAVLVNILSVIGFVGFVFVRSQQLQLVLGLDPIAAGLVLLPGLAVMVLAGLLVVPVARRIGPHATIPVSLLFSLAAYLMLAVTPADAGPGFVALAFALLGLGIGAAETVSNDLILATAPPAKAGAAAAVSETAYEVGALLGTTLIGGALAMIYRSALLVPQGLSAPAEAQARETLAGAIALAQELPAAQGAALRDAAAAAFDAGMSVSAWAGLALMLGAILLAAIALRPRPAGGAARQGRARSRG